MKRGTSSSAIARVIPASCLALLFILAGCATGSLRQPMAEFDATDIALLPPDITAPVAVRTVAPKHPVWPLRTGIEGSAWVRCLIDETGTVRDAAVVNATYVDFGDAALDAIKQWSFVPAKRSGQPFAVRVVIPFHFDLSSDVQGFRR